MSNLDLFGNSFLQMFLALEQQKLISTNNMTNQILPQNLNQMNSFFLPYVMQTQEMLRNVNNFQIFQSHLTHQADNLFLQKKAKKVK
jgi:hypothetical protein